MRIVVTSVFVEDQEKALSFYTEVLGFQKKTDIPLGEDRWLTVVSPEEPDGVELLLEPSGHPAVKPFKQALVEDGIPFTSFGVEDVKAEHARLEGLGVKFTQPPTTFGEVTTAVFGDTCGNLIQIAQKQRGHNGVLISDGHGGDEGPRLRDPALGLSAFRSRLYGCFGRRADALFELTEAILTTNTNPSLVHLSPASVHRRGWGSLYAALNKGRIGAGVLRNLLARLQLADDQVLDTLGYQSVDIQVNWMLAVIYRHGGA